MGVGDGIGAEVEVFVGVIVGVGVGLWVAARAVAEVERTDEDTVLNYTIHKFYRILNFEKERAEVTKEMIKKATQKWESFIK